MPPAPRPPGGLSVNSGGAIYHRENIVLANTTFHENRAGDEGLAVLGSTTATLHNVSFANNTFYCAFGQYLYDETFGAVSDKETLASSCRKIIAPPKSANGGVSRNHERYILPGTFVTIVVRHVSFPARTSWSDLARRCLFAVSPTRSTHSRQPQILPSTPC